MTHIDSINDHAKETVKLFFMHYVGYNPNIRDKTLDILSIPSAYDLISLINMLGRKPTQKEIEQWSETYKKEFRIIGKELKE